MAELKFGDFLAREGYPRRAIYLAPATAPGWVRALLQIESTWRTYHISTARWKRVDRWSDT